MEVDGGWKYLKYLLYFLKAYCFYRNDFLSWGINFETMKDQWYGMD